MPADEDFLRQLAQLLMRLDPRRCSDREWMEDYVRWPNEMLATSASNLAGPPPPEITKSARASA